MLLNARARSQIDVAGAQFRQIQALLRPEDPPTMRGGVANAAGQFHGTAGRDKLSEVELRRAVELFTAAGKPGDAAGMRNNLANALRSQAKYDEAVAEYRASLEFLEDKLGPDHPALGTAYAGLAAVMQAKGERAIGALVGR